MAVATKNRRLADAVQATEAQARLGITKGVLDQLIARGYFSPRRLSPLSAQSRRLVFVDEIDRYLELCERFPLPRDRGRIFNGMMQHRAEQGRIGK